jgi:hypothetical protein
MRWTVLAAAAAAMGITASSASAATYCVPGVFTGCAGTPKPTLADAVTAANGTSAPDDIFLAAGTFAGGVTVGAYPVHIHGAGKDLTKIEGGGGSYGVGMDQPESSITDLTIHELSGGHTTALSLSGSAQRVVVDQRSNAATAYAAVILRDEGSFEDGAALAPLDTPGADYGIAADSTGPMLISGVEVQGRYAATTSGPGPVTIRFARLTGNIYGVETEALSTLVEDSVVTGAPLVAYLSSGPNITTTARHVTLNGTFAGVESYVSAGTARLVISNTAVVGGGPDPETPDLDITTGTGAVGRIEADYSFFRAAHVTHSGTGTNEYVPGAHNIDGADAKLVNLTGGDLRPRFDSPLVDAGDPVPGGGEPMADLAGEFRAVNGRTDIGAYEYGRHAPIIDVVVDPKEALVGGPVSFVAGTRDTDPGESPVVTWSFDDGTTAAGAIVTHAFTSPGPHAATATATDPAGLTATASASVAISAVIPPAKAMAPSFGFKKLKARKGVVRVLLRCPAAATDCAGTVELQLAPKPKAKGGSRAAKTVVLGKARYAIAHGTHKTIKVKLTRGARKRLARARRGLRVRVVAKPKGAARRSKTVRLTRR